MSRMETLDRLKALVNQPAWERIFDTVQAAEKMGLKKVALQTVYEAQYQAVLALIEEGLYRMDPDLNNTGRPWGTSISDEYGRGQQAHMWILTSEPAEKPDVIIDLKDPATWKDLQQLHPQKDQEKVEELKKQGYLYSGKWKDLVELTKYRTLDEDKTPEGPPCSNCAGNLTVKIEGIRYWCKTCGHIFDAPPAEDNESGPETREYFPDDMTEIQEEEKRLTIEAVAEPLDEDEEVA